MNPLSLHALHGQVHRFRGVLDRFGAFPQAGRLIHTLCVRQLQLAGTEQPVAPDHWWFRLREDWVRVGIDQGDTVLFTAKVQRCSKGWDQVVGLGGTVRDVVVTRRSQRPSLMVSELEQQVRCQALLLAEAEAEARRLAIHRDALLRDVQDLQGRLRLTAAPCRTSAERARRSPSLFVGKTTHPSGGFARVSG